MKYLRYPLYLLILALAGFLFLLIYGTLSDYKPEKQTLVFEKADAPLISDSIFRMMTWNIGYCGLGEEMDFFYDGGRGVRPDRATSEANLEGVIDYAKTLDSCDFLLFQEVDIKSKRSYRIDQLKALEEALFPVMVSFGKNFDVAFNPAPPRAPIGRVLSGIATLGRQVPTSGTRYSFPGNYPWPKGVFMLDRCFLVNRYPLAGNRELLVINTHNSAYDDGSLRKAQMEYLHGFLTGEYGKGNYVIVGGDWNQTPFGFRPLFERDVFDTLQLSYIPEHYLPGEWTWLYDPSVPSNRRVDKPYSAGTSRTTVIDFFLLSPNLEPLYVKGVDLDFIHSDHNPVLAGFRLK
jgi:hypothetical protein